MTLGSAINSALSGLSMASRATLTIASNVANATTEGYARRELETVARDAARGSPGVRVVTENRILDAGLLGERRRTDAAVAVSATRADALSTLERAFGVPGEPGALVTRVGQFEAALIEAASRPDSTSRLDTVLREAQGLAGDIRGMGALIQDERTAADAQLEAEVARLNDGLAEVHRLNELIQREIATGQVPNGLKDQRQRVIDGLADLVPLREVERPGGRVVLFTDNGGILLDGKPARFEMTSLGRPVDATAQATGAQLFLVTGDRPPPLDRVEIPTGAPGMLAGGRIEALFDVRDTLLPDAQESLDEVAAHLIRRFQIAEAVIQGIPGALEDEATVLPEGLFINTVPGTTVGLAQVLEVRALQPGPAPNGTVWRLRDGLEAAAEGSPGNAAGLTALANALQEFRPLNGATGSARDLAGHVADLASGIGRGRDAAELQLASATARNTALRESEAGFGVDTDAEMQRLLVMERLYAANARVLTAADEMMQRLLAI